MNPTDDVMDRLTAADPLRGQELHAWASTIEGQNVLREIRSQAARQRAPRRAQRLPLRSIATACAALLIASFVATRTPEPVSIPREHRADGPRDVLEGVALTAARSEGMTAGPGQYIYRKMVGQGTGTQEVAGRLITALIPIELEAWIAHDDGSGIVKGTTGEPEFLTAEDRQWWIEAGSPPYSDVGPTVKELPDSDYPQEDVASYPTDPDELEALLRQRADETHSCPQPTSGAVMECPPADEDAYVFTTASNLLLHFPDADPKLRAALFEVMSRVPGTQVDNEARDPKGRPGAMVSIVFNEDGGRRQRHEFYFETSTAEVLGFRDVFLDEQGNETTYAYSALLDSGVVDRAGQRP